MTNASSLTYEIQCHSTCDKDHFEYVDADEDSRHTWKTTFTAPWRWSAKARPSEGKARIAAQTGVRRMPDREVDIEITCEAAGHSQVGPFKILLQVDVEDA